MVLIVADLDRIELRRYADDIAAGLYDDLKAKKIRAINIDVITAACDAAWSGPPDYWRRDHLIDLTTRRVVERASLLRPESVAPTRR
jgi:hypothetical protein